MTFQNVFKRGLGDVAELSVFLLGELVDRDIVTERRLQVGDVGGRVIPDSVEGIQYKMAAALNLGRASRGSVRQCRNARRGVIQKVGRPMPKP